MHILFSNHKNHDTHFTFVIWLNLVISLFQKELGRTMGCVVRDVFQRLRTEQRVAKSIHLILCCFELKGPGVYALLYPAALWLKVKSGKPSAETKKTKLSDHNMLLMRTCESGNGIRSASVWNNELLITISNTLRNTSNVFLCTPAKSTLARSLGARRIIWLSSLQKCHSRLILDKKVGVNGLFKSLLHAGGLWALHWLQTSCHCSPTLIGRTDRSSHTRALTRVAVSRWSACVSRNLKLQQKP